MILRISVYAIFLLILLIFQFCIPLSMIRPPRIQRQRYDNATTTQNMFGELIFCMFFILVQILLIFIFCTTLSNNRAPQSQQQRHNNATTTQRQRHEIAESIRGEVFEHTFPLTFRKPILIACFSETALRIGGQVYPSELRISQR